MDEQKRKKPTTAEGGEPEPKAEPKPEPKPDGDLDS